MHTFPAKPSPLGPLYHYHETGDGPDYNTTDSAIDDRPHSHGFAVGPNHVIDSNKTTGLDHTHYFSTRRPVIKGPGLGEKNAELKAELQNMVELVIRVTNELHSSARFHNDSRHSGTSWRKCKSWICQDALKRITSLADYMLPNNPHALRQYRANLRKLQKAIKSAPPDLT